MGIAVTDRNPTVGTSTYWIGAGSTSQSLQTDDAMVQVFLDLSNLAAGDEFTLEVVETAGASASDGEITKWTFVGAQSQPTFVTPAFVMAAGWDYGLTKVSGTDRAIPCSLRKVT